MICSSFSVVLLLIIISLPLPSSLLLLSQHHGPHDVERGEGAGAHRRRRVPRWVRHARVALLDPGDGDARRARVADRERRRHPGVRRSARGQKVGPEPPDPELGALGHEGGDEQAGGDVEAVVEHRERRRGCRCCCNRGRRRTRRALSSHQLLAGGRKLDGGGGDEPAQHRHEERHQRRDRVRVVRVGDGSVVDVKGPLPGLARCLEDDERQDGDGDDGKRLQPREVARDEAPVDGGEERRRFLGCSLGRSRCCWWLRWRWCCC